MSAGEKNAAVSARQVFSSPAIFTAFGFGSGLFPKAPGTAGTLVAIPFAVMLSKLPFWAEISVIIVMFAFGVWLCGHVADELGVHDHSGIVWDEIVGYLIAVLFVPHTPLWWLLGFAFFRFFDIVKPWPIREMDHRISGGLGIMLDDVVAGIFSAVCLALIALGMAMI